MRISAILLLFLTAFALPVPEPDDPRAPVEVRPPTEVFVPSSEQINAYRAQPAFRYDRRSAEPDNILARVRRAIAEWWNSLWTSRAARTFWEVFPYLLLAGAIILIVLRLLEGKFGTALRGTPASIDVEEVTEDIHTIDFDAMIREAVNHGRLREAFRLTYLQLLKRLNDAGLIRWRPEKTNREYAREISDPGLREPFNRLTGLFEFVWYGEFSMDRDAFEKASSEARQISDRVRNG